MVHPGQDRISHHLQVGGIETAVLDNGAARGTRIAWINTGAGLRYKVVIDRAMDIADAAFNHYNLAWLSYGGVTAPESVTLRGTDWLRTFGGGLVTTCGLHHFGPPEKDEHGERGLHGLISNQPAVLESVIQPDPAKGQLDMSITGRIRETQPFGPSFELKRTISGTVGQPVIRIHDEVTNLANTTMPHMILYHCNFGWPLIDEGADILWKGSLQPGSRPGDKAIFNDNRNFRKCPAPMDEHSGTGEAVGFIKPDADSSGNCSCAVYNAKLKLLLAVHFNKNQLPWLTNWQHWGKNEYVMGLEPGTNPPIGQGKARSQNELLFLEPGQTRAYDLTFEIATDDQHVREILKQYNL